MIEKQNLITIIKDQSKLKWNENKYLPRVSADIKRTIKHELVTVVGDHQKGPNINHGWSVVKTLKRMHFQKEQTNSPNRPNNKISQLT